MDVKHVSQNYICQLWPQVEGFLTEALKYSQGEYTIEQLKLRLVDGAFFLLVALDGDVVKGACVISLDNLPNARIAWVWAIGGKGIATKELYAQLEHWCKAMGCTKIRGAARESVARLWQRFAYKEVYRIVEKDL